jgi:putative SOS response-associated peptidase YedK
MCGRYCRTTSEEELARRYHIPIPKELDLPISYNIAPKDPKMPYKTINARVEAVDTAPSYRQAFKKRRWLAAVHNENEDFPLSRLWPVQGLPRRAA